MKPTNKLRVNGTANSRAIVKGQKYRFTVLTQYMLRMEYDPEGAFTDAPTQMAIDRQFPVPAYQTHLENEQLLIRTDGFELRYDTSRPFHRNSLSIRVHVGPPIGENVWYYGDSIPDLHGTARTLDNADGAVPLGHGLISREGYALLDDSRGITLDETGWVQPRDHREIDLYFFAYGFRYAQCLKDFFHLAGATPVLPRWALGNWWSRFHRYTDAEYRTLMETFSEKQVPLSVAVIDMDWHLTDIDPKFGNGWTGYTWNRELFPDPPAFLAWLHERGLHTTLNIHPADGIRAFEDPYPAMAKELGVDAAAEEAISFDAADEHFLQVYFKHINHPMEEQGVDFWWVDWQQGKTTSLEGLDPLWALNHSYFLDSGRDGKRPLTFSRYAGPGSHRYPIGFSGDSIVSWQSLQFQPYFTATATNIGYCWWSHDIGGHMMGSHDDELATRWVQFGVFSPIMRLHSTSNPFNSKEPWKHSRESCEIIENFMRLRHRLIPYLYTMNRNLAVDGEALIQPMYYREPANWDCYKVPNEYYFGSEMIVAPITQPLDPTLLMGSADVWLPEGEWTDYFTGTRYQGGRMITLWRPMDEIPVLVKAGGILPLCDWDTPADGNPEMLEIQVFPGADGCFTLWEDDGVGDGFAMERWASTRFALDWESKCFSIGAAKGNLAALPDKRRYTVAFRGIAACEVTAAGAEGVEILTEYDADTLTLYVRLPELTARQGLTLTFPNGMHRAEHTVPQRIFKRLYRAKLPYDLKAQIMNAVETLGIAATGSFASMGLQPPLVQALTELLTARYQTGEDTL